MRNLAFLILILNLFCAPGLQAAPSFSSGTSTPHAIAYQDHDDPTQFYYVPLATQSILGERLTSFRATHFGVGRAYYVQKSNSDYVSVSGAMIAGTFSLDLNEVSRSELTRAIKRNFNIDNAKLLPLPLRNVQISSVLLSDTIGQFGTVEQRLPAGFQIGPEVAFSAGSLNSLFAQTVANSQIGFGIQPNPLMALNFDAKAEFVGDPWTAKISCDLAKVWSYTRSKASVSASVGWFRVGSASYERIAQELKDAGICSFDMTEGSLDTATYGRQVMEMTKRIFEEINNLAINGQGFFRFEPIPEPPAGGGGGASARNLFGYSLSVNAAYTSAHFKQEKRWEETISYTGRIEAPVALSAVMAVACGPNTKQFFADLADATEACITQEKIEMFLARAQAEKNAKDRRIRSLIEKLENGQITPEQYGQILRAYEGVSFTENHFRAMSVKVPLKNNLLATSGSQKSFSGYVTGLSDAEIDSLEATILRE